MTEEADGMRLMPETGEMLISASEETRQVLDIDAMRSDIKDRATEVAELKRQIGEYYWLRHSTSEDYEPELKGAFIRIRSLLDSIVEAEAGMNMIEDGEGQPIQPPVELHIDMIVCQSCGTLNSGSEKQCSSCGLPLKETPMPEYHVEDYGICPLCGSSLPDDALFCYSCGARVKI